MNTPLKLLVGVFFVTLLTTGAMANGGPIGITNCEELQAMAEYRYGYYVLENNIDCSDTVNWNGGKGFLPIGNTNVPFQGMLDGQGHEITGLYINRVGTRGDYIGLFGILRDALVADLVLRDVDITGKNRVGALAGASRGGAIFDVKVYGGTVTGMGDATGGLVGISRYSRHSDYTGLIIGGHSSADVFGIYEVGGLVGINQGILVRSSASGEVNGELDMGIEEVFGLSFNIRDIEYFDCVGGLVGRNGPLIETTDRTAGFILGSYATGDVSGIVAGGLSGCSFVDFLYVIDGITSTTLDSLGIDLPEELITLAAESETSEITTYEDLGDYIDLSKFDGSFISSSGGNIETALDSTVYEGDPTILMDMSVPDSEIMVYDIPISIIGASYATGNVYGFLLGGGLVGGDYGITINSYATGDVDAFGAAGGLTGMNMYLTLGTFSTGFASAILPGGLVGVNMGGIEDAPGVIYSFYHNSTDNPYYCIGLSFNQTAYNNDSINCTGAFNLLENCTFLGPLYPGECVGEVNEDYFFDVVDTNPPFDEWNFEDVWNPIYDDQYYPPLRWQDAPPLTIGFSGGTDFSQVENMSAIENLTLTSGNASITWSGTVNATGQNFDEHITFGPGFVSIDTDALGGGIGGEATITLFGISCPKVPYYSGGTFSTLLGAMSEGKICDDTTDPKCTNIACTGDTLVFTVSHFTSFAAGNPPGEETTGKTTYHYFDEPEVQELGDVTGSDEPGDDASKDVPETVPEEPETEDTPLAEPIVRSDDSGATYILLALLAVILIVVFAVKKGIIEMPKQWKNAGGGI